MKQIQDMDDVKDIFYRIRELFAECDGFDEFNETESIKYCQDWWKEELERLN